MTTDPLLPAWLLLLVVIVVTGATWRAYHRGPRLPATLRALALALLVIVAINPVRLVPAPPARLPGLVAVLDASNSMATADVAGRARLEAARTALDQLIARTEGAWRIERLALADGLAPAWPEAAAGGTDFSALAALADRPRPPAVVVIASDGRDHGDRDPGQALAAAGIETHALRLGGGLAADNLAVTLRSPSPSAFPGQELRLVATVRASGSLRNQDLIVTLSEEGTSRDRRPLAAVAGEAEVDFTVPITGQPGTRVFEVAIEERPGEVTHADNRAGVAVQVVDRPIRVLFAEGQPFWDSTFALRALRRDRQLVVHSRFDVGRRAYASGDDPPFSPDDLSELDVVLLGVQLDSVLDVTTQEAIVAWVADGGTALFCGVHAGHAGPLAAIDPLLRNRERHREVALVATESGRDLALLSGQPPQVTSGDIAGLRPRTEILLGDPQRPLVVRRRHGAGRVAAINAEGLWRWNLEPDTRRRGDGADRFWQQLVKALVAGHGGMTADRPRYRLGETARIHGAEGSLTVLDPAGNRQQLPAQTIHRVDLDQAGWWRFATASATVAVVAEPDLRELRLPGADDTALARLVGPGGGSLLDAAEAGGLAARLRRRADLSQRPPERQPLVLEPWWALLLVALLAGEWLWRRLSLGVV